jgi:hypothetical protein
MQSLVTCLLGLLLFSCSPGLSPVDAKVAEGVDGTYLFVGNSLSYSNDLPTILQEIAAEFGQDIKADCLCKPNYALIDHWNDGDVIARINSQVYDQIILQQGPSSQAFGRSILLEYGPKVSTLANENQAKTSFYMVWPSKAYYATFQGVIDNYTEAARVSEAGLFPVGQVWKDYIAQTGDESLYGSDAFHPSVKGSFLAAWVIFRFLNPDLEIETLPDFPKYITAEDFAKLDQLISIPD